MTGQQPEALEADYLEAVQALERMAHPAGGDGRAFVAAANPPAEARAAAAEIPAPHTTVRTWPEECFRDLLEALPDGILVINQEGGIELVNHQVEILFGYRRDELLGQAIEILVPERIRAVHVAFRQGYFAAPKTRPLGGAGVELFGRRKDGSEFPVEISLSPLRFGEEVLATAAIRDVSRIRRAEAKFRTLVDNIPAVTFIAPLDHSLPELYVSPQIEQMLGFSQQEWLADPILWHRQLHPDDRERWTQHFAPTCAAGKPFRAEYRFIARDGRVVWVHGSANLVRDAEGNLLFLQGVAFDVTALKEAEETLRRSNAELDRRVQERTEALVRSMAELQEKTDELEQFAYHAVHDLKEPLRTVLTNTQRLDRESKGQLTGKALERIERITDGTDGMRRLLDKLRDYAHVTRRDETKPVDCAAAVAAACSSLQAAVDESGAVIHVGELPTVSGMPEHLSLLFQNLISNAIKYQAPDRVPHIDISARRHGDGWLFQIRDNGIGIEAKYLKRIFLLSERLHSRSVYEGWGYGLAICEKTVRRHGGQIWAASEPGQGSTFSFTLPDRPPDHLPA